MSKNRTKTYRIKPKNLVAASLRSPLFRKRIVENKIHALQRKISRAKIDLTKEDS